MGCCTSLLYGTTGVSKNTVKVALNLALPSLTTPEAVRPPSSDLGFKD